MVVAVAVVVATKPPLSRSNRGRSHQVAVEPQPCFVTKSLKFRFGELSFGASGSKSRDLKSGHGFRTCSLKNQRIFWDFHTCWEVKKRNLYLCTGINWVKFRFGEELLVEVSTEF